MNEYEYGKKATNKICVKYSIPSKMLTNLFHDTVLKHQYCKKFQENLYFL